MFIAYGVLVANVSIGDLLLSGVVAELLLLLFQAATVYVVVRRLGFFKRREFAGMATVARTGWQALPVILVPFIIVGGILKGVFTPSESGAAALVVALMLAMFWYGSISVRDMPRILTFAGIETGIVMLLVGDSAILAKVLQVNGFGSSLQSFLLDLTSDKYVFLLAVNVLLLLVGIFVEPLPALFIFAPFLAPIADHFGMDPTHFGLIVVFNLVLALIHPPIGLVLFLVSSISKVPIERLSIMILPWLGVSLLVLERGARACSPPGICRQGAARFVRFGGRGGRDLHQSRSIEGARIGRGKTADATIRGRAMLTSRPTDRS
jgi:tripartite ATP-independent transporter DctM subunit